MNATSEALVTDAQREAFKTDGYFITDILFDEATLAGVGDEFIRLWQESTKHLEGVTGPSADRARYRPFGLSRLDGRSTICDAFCRHPAFMQLARELVGPDVEMSYNQAIVKPPSPIDNSFGWHQDMCYALRSDYKDSCDLELLTNADTPCITCWVAITRTIVDNGTLWVLPGRHREGLLDHVWSDERDEWTGTFDTSWKIPAVLHAGQVIVFHKYLPHGSGANLTDEFRMAYQIGYSIPGVNLVPTPDMVPVLRGGEPFRQESN